MKVILYLLLLVVLCLSLHPELVSSAATCTCTCCTGNLCAATLQGQFSASSCSECNRDGCSSRYASCPTSDQSGVSYASCGGSSSLSPAESWAGTYVVVSKCSSECCCLGGTLTVTAESSTTAVINGRLVGQYCPIFDPIEVPVENITPGNIIYTAVEGTAYRISRNGKNIAVDNTMDPVCSGRAECVNGNCLQNTSAASLTSVNSYLMLVLLAVVAFLH